MTPEQRRALDEILADATAAQTFLARAVARSNTAGAHGVADTARAPLATALAATREATDRLRKAATNG